MAEEPFNIISFLKSAVATGASDEHLKVGHPPYIRKNGFIKRTNLGCLTKEDLDNAILEIAPLAIRDKILTICDLDFMYEINHIIEKYGIIPEHRKSYGPVKDYLELKHE